MDPDSSENRQDSPSRSGFFHNPPTGSSSSQPDLTDPPQTEPVGNESSNPPADPHAYTSKDTTDVQAPTYKEIDVNSSDYPSYPLTPDRPSTLKFRYTSGSLCPSLPPASTFPPPPPPPPFWKGGGLNLPDIDELASLGFRDDTGELLSNRIPTDTPSSSSPIDSSAPSMVGAGLQNLGNTCFLNSVLQCLTHTASFVNGLLSLKHNAADCVGIDGFCVLCALLDHVELALALSEVISPSDIVDHLSYFSSDFSAHVQQDAHEFFLAFLDKLERCFPKSQNKEDRSSHQDRNLVEEIFRGQIVDRISCSNCGHHSESYQPSLDISLGIDGVDTLSKALEDYTKAENIEYTCESCKQGAQQKRCLLHKIPPVAVIQLKRFRNIGRYVGKSDLFVEYPLELDLQPYSTDNPNNETLQYDLYAVLVHEGVFLQRGHYYCFVRSSSDVWHKFNDTEVTSEKACSALSQQAYMLFYARRGTPWMSTILESLNSFHDPSSSKTSKMSVPNNVDSAPSSHPSAAGDESCDAGKPRATEGRGLHANTSSGASKQDIADNSSFGSSSTSPVPSLARLAKLLKRSFSDVIEKSCSEDLEGHHQHQEIKDKEESDASPSKCSVPSLASLGKLLKTSFPNTLEKSSSEDLEGHHQHQEIKDKEESDASPSKNSDSGRKFSTYLRRRKCRRLSYQE